MKQDAYTYIMKINQIKLVKWYKCYKCKIAAEDAKKKVTVYFAMKY